MTSTLLAHAPTSSFRKIEEAEQVAPGRYVLGIVNFTTDCANPTIDEGYPSVGIHMTHSAEDGFAEVWTSGRPVEAGQFQSISYAEDGEFLFCACRIPEMPDYVEATEAVYATALELADSLGYGQIFRIWHYISRLNEENAGGLEVYQEFCVGRARVLERRGITDRMPAATVIGSHGGGIVIYFLACRAGTQVNIENPRQVPAYYYPNRYGPRSPNFARATYLASGGGERIYVSGTAGILGHRTMHLGDVESQLRLALDNVAHVIGAGNLSGYDIEPGSGLGDLRGIKVYVRHHADLPRVERICREAFSPSADIMFLNADICRSDLLVEVEGIVVRDHLSADAGTAVSGSASPSGAPSTMAAGVTRECRTLPAAQQPDWRSHPAYERVMAKLSEVPPLVLPGEIHELRAGLAAVAAGSARVLQVGDCAESFYESTHEQTVLRTGMLDRLARRFGARVGEPVLKIGRIGGQYAKPRSHPVEVVDGVELPAFRGHMVNGEAPSTEARRHDPLRMLWSYHFSDQIQRTLRAHRGEAGDLIPHPGPWSSHDALVMDYIAPLVRVDESTGDRFLGTTHFPWVGERTGGVDEAHVKLLSLVSNPVAAKIGPRTNPESVLRLCELLDPGREPGRLTLIVRMGCGAVGAALPPIVRAVRDAGHPVVWLSDPMHGNTVRLPSGIKTRYLDQLVAEAVEFRDILENHGQHVGGLHLETAAYDVTECVGGPVARDDVADKYTTLCDPRLNFEQAAKLIDLVF